MRVVSWNCRRASATHGAWAYLRTLEPDLALLQEVVSVPADVRRDYQIEHRRAVGKTGAAQRFGTAILTRGALVQERPMQSSRPWVTRELEAFRGNLISHDVEIGQRRMHAVSVYSPAWPIPPARLAGVEPGDVRLTQQPSSLWLTDLLRDALRCAPHREDEDVVVGGDFNSSVTFDTCWGKTPRGNAEYFARLDELGLTECLRHVHGRLVPTFRSPRGGKVIHQMDHLFVSASMLGRLTSCAVGDEEAIFGASLSDHLTIIADFAD